jgi:hypothetical protein
VDELRIKLSQYVAANPQFPALSLNELLQRCPVSSKCERFLRSPKVSYHPFASSSPDEQPVLVVDRGKEGVAIYSKADLCRAPEYAN